MRSKIVIALVGTVAVASACVNVFWRTTVVPLDPATRTARFVRTPLKAHLSDGSTVVFRDGAYLTSTQVSGNGFRYALLSQDAQPAPSISLDSIVAFETFEGRVMAAPTVITTVAATALGALATAVLAVAIFGSCPTVYADTGTGPVLEAEGFSYAIAPLFEHRDVDRLRVRPGADGVIRLELRNEALETHYINSIELLAASHAPGVRVLPDQSNRLAAVGDVRPLTAARDRAGRDVRAQLAVADGNLFATDASTLAAARAGDLNDWIDLEADGVPAGDSLTVVLRLRNSLLNTVLLYDEMLSNPDALEWLHRELQTISTAVDLSRWYTRTMGMHAAAGADAATLAAQSPTARLNDVGPLAFRDVALVLPRPPSRDGTVRVRLRFVADNWRIDYAAIGGAPARPASRTVGLSRVTVPHPATGGPAVADTAALAALSDTDDRYLETRPGQRMTLEFDAGRTTDPSTTYSIAWQGWYREWIRKQWVTTPARTTTFVPGDSSLMSAMRKWRERQVEFERQFYSTRIPVR